MKYTLAPIFCVLSAMAVNAQEPRPIAPPLASVQQEPVIRDSYQHCANKNNVRPFGESRLYRWAVTDWEQSPMPNRNTNHATLWFIPMPRALLQAICP